LVCINFSHKKRTPAHDRDPRVFLGAATQPDTLGGDPLKQHIIMPATPPLETPATPVGISHIAAKRPDVFTNILQSTSFKERISHKYNKSYMFNMDSTQE
jgi:hypothetical protein